MAGILPVTRFLTGGFFKPGYRLLWLAFVAILIIECINLMQLIFLQTLIGFP